MSVCKCRCIYLWYFSRWCVETGQRKWGGGGGIGGGGGCVHRVLGLVCAWVREHGLSLRDQFKG